MRKTNLEPTLKLWKLTKLRNKAAIDYAHNLVVYGECSNITVTSYRRLLRICELDRQYSDAHKALSDCIANIELELSKQ